MQKDNAPKDGSDSLDYKALGFMCGIEAHQQLETHKLFCDCQSIVHDSNPKVMAKRRLKAVVGETGEIDVAALHEEEKGKLMVYEGCRDSSCLVEIDEEPPHPINMEAVDIALQVAKMCHCEIVDEIQVMRKTVIDGSNVGGFQRTALIGMDGYIETSKGRVAIPTIMLEEESARKVSSDNDKVVYRLDRLGVPLIEMSTDASLKDPDHAKEAAGIIGMILRSTGRVKRGIGTIRQDVNVSIKGHPRVEIKGFQELKLMPEVIRNEIKRMMFEIKSGKALLPHVRKFNDDCTTEYLRPMPGGARMYPETDVMPIIVSKQAIDSIKLPTLISEKKDSLSKKYRLDDGLVAEIVDKGIDFESLAGEFAGIEPGFIASVLVQLPKEIKRKEGIDTDRLGIADFKEILKCLTDGNITKDAVPEILAKKAKGEKIDLGSYKALDDAAVEAEILKIINEKPGLNIGGYMGIVMAKFRGRIDGKRASALISRIIQ